MRSIQQIILLITFIGAIVTSCSTEKPAFVIESNLNPWPDDYTGISGMRNYQSWGTYNVHDPACFKVENIFYMYSTDAIFRENKEEAKEAGIPLGYIQVRKSTDLVNWEFHGWAFTEIPEEAVKHVHENNAGKGATNIWAPYPLAYNGKYRLYYSVSAFGKSISYLGLAESDSPEGPWELKGCVVKTDSTSQMNAIDPSVIITGDNEHWMVYGSYFGGLYAVQLNPETGLTFKEGDQGYCIARRANGKKDNIEAPEIIYHPGFGKYYLFVSYDPLMTTYNVRVGRSDSPEGPYYDMFGVEMKDETNNYPVLTHPYRFNNHPGWAGTAHCGVVADKGRYYMMHQGRLSPGNHMMDLHLREIFWTGDGWPAISPERYAGISAQTLTKPDFVGEWEIVLIRDNKYERDLWAGQILWGEGELRDNEINVSVTYTFTDDGKITGEQEGEWDYDEKDGLQIKIGDEIAGNVIPHTGQDWENEQITILFTGIEKHGFSIWGKRIR